jgi:hypothetical protein
MPDDRGPEKKAADLVGAVHGAAQLHLPYETLEAYARNSLDSEERLLVQAHAELCPRCAAELRDLESFAVSLAQPEEEASAPEEQKTSFWPGFWAWARQPRNAIAFTTILAAAIILPTLTRFVQRPATVAGRTSDSALVAALRSGKSIDAQLAKLPAPWQKRIRTLLDGGTISRPVSLSFLPPRQGAGLLFPVQESVADTQPALRFEPRSSPVRIRLLDSSGTVVAESPPLSAPEWKVPFALQRGAIYRWEVNRNDAASFRVLTNEEFAEWSRVSGLYPDVLLIQGALALEFGLYEDAARALAALPESEVTRRLTAAAQTR